MKVFLSFAEYVCVCNRHDNQAIIQINCFVQTSRDVEEQRGISLIPIQITCEDFACQRKFSRPILIMQLLLFYNYRHVFVFK